MLSFNEKSKWPPERKWVLCNRNADVLDDDHYAMAAAAGGDDDDDDDKRY